MQTTIKDAQRSLFEEWKKIEPTLSTDGVVDEVAYLATSPKLVFVLKETNDPGDNWDLCEFLRNDGSRGSTWNSVARWVQAIRDLPRETPWRDFPEKADELSNLRRAQLRSIVAVNLKKKPGGHTTFAPLLREHAMRDRELLKKQLALYQPHLFICCGTQVGDCLGEIYGPEVVKWKMTSRGIYYSPFIRVYTRLRATSRGENSETHPSLRRR